MNNNISASTSNGHPPTDGLPNGLGPVNVNNDNASVAQNANTAIPLPIRIQTPGKIDNTNVPLGQEQQSNGTAPLQQQQQQQPVIQTQNFKIGEQKVQLDVDMLKNGITGITELVVFPQNNQLREVVLDCQDTICIIDVSISTFVSNQPLLYTDIDFEHYNASAVLEDTIKPNAENQIDPFYSSGNYIQQVQQVKEWKVGNKFDPFNGKRINSKLFIPVPQDIIQLNQLQPFDELSPFTVKIEYYIENPKEGVVFNTSRFHDLRIRSCYTNNNLLNNSTSYWVPCVDSMNEKYLWQIEIMTPRTLKDIYYLNQEDLSTVYKDHLLAYKDISDTKHGSSDDIDAENDKNTDETGKKKNYDINVVCGDSTTEKIQIVNEHTKKTIFQLLNPVSPQHVGFAIGCFGKIVLPTIYAQKAQDAVNGGATTTETFDSLSSQNVPLIVYYPLMKSKSRASLDDDDIQSDEEEQEEEGDDDFDEYNQEKYENDIINTVMTLPKMLDYYIKNFGSFPFNSYTICFVPNLIVPDLDFLGLSIIDSSMIYTSKDLDPVFPHTIKISKIFASQWALINITPQTINDIWCCVGIAGFMSLKFVQHLMGTNEFKYRLKLLSEEIVEQDYNKPPLALVEKYLSFPVSLNEQSCNDIVEFMKLKAPMVLYILDRRMTKMERSFGMVRIIQKLMVQALSGELVNCSLSTANFQHMCERVYKDKLENFFQEWIYGSGVPIFRITQKFNKKRMMIEMGIKQVHIEEAKNPHLGSNETSDWNFIHDAATNMKHKSSLEELRTPFFTGSMTIRVHEADGIPYEHVVRLTEQYAKLDVQYNTKYKRLRNRRRVNEKKISEQNANPGEDEIMEDTNANEEDDIAIDAETLRMNCLGDVLTSKQDCRVWNLTDFSMTTSNLDENQLQNEAFEWLRVDTDFEWICQIHLNQPDYMFASQLQQDKDVEAQVDSIRFLEDCIGQSDNNSLVYSSILTRTIMDTRYFYGVRLEAIRALAKFDIKVEDYQTFQGGFHHLLKIYKSWYCYENNENMPMSNNFVNVSSYLVQQRLLEQFCNIKDETGEFLPIIKAFLLDLLKYNNNNGNEFNDTEHVRNLINCVFKIILKYKRDKKWNIQAWKVINRYESLDRWNTTENFRIYGLVMEWKTQMIIEDYYEPFFELEDFVKDLFENCWLENLKFKFPRASSESLVKLNVFCLKNMLVLSFKNKEFLKFYFETICFNMEPYIAHNATNAFVDALNFIAINGCKDTYMNDDIETFQKKYNPHYKADLSKCEKLEDFSDDEEDDINIASTGSKPSGEIDIVFGSSAKQTELSQKSASSARSRKEAKLKSSIPGLLQLLRNVFESYEPLKQILWFLINAPLFDDHQRKIFFDIVPVLYEQKNKYLVSLAVPNDRKLVAVKSDKYVVKIQRDTWSKYDPPPPPKVAPPPKIKPLKITLKPNTVKAPKKMVNTSTPVPKTPVKPVTAKPVTVKTSAKTPVKVSALPLVAVPIVKKPQKVVKSSVFKVGNLTLSHVKLNTKKKKVELSSVPFNNNVVFLKSGLRSLKFKLLFDKNKLKKK